MAISKIKKIELFGLQKDKDNLLESLQKLGIVELTAIQQSPASPSPQVTTTETNLSEIEETISFLNSFQEKAGILEGMVKLKPLVYSEQLEEVMADFDYQGLLKELLFGRNQLKVNYQHKERLDQERHLLSVWDKLTIPLDQIHSTQKCGILLGVVRTADYANLSRDCEKENIDLFCEAINQDKANIHLVIFYIQEEFQPLEAILKKHHFNFVTLSRHKARVKERLLEINREALILDGQIQDVRTQIVRLSKEQFKLMVVYDYLANIKKRQEAGQFLAKQQFTFNLNGWIRRKDVRLLEKTVGDKFRDIAIFISEPKANENIPTALENKPVIRPFEAVTNLYGQPAYNGLDPTGFLAPFFAISFGFCLLDAGYGLVLLAIMLFFLRKKQISAAGKNFLRLFLYASIATIFAGLITGSFFGDLISRLPGQFIVIKNLQKRLILFEPINDSLIFLGFTLALGFIQVWTGVFIKFLKDLRWDRFAAFILDLPTLLVQTSLLILALIFARVLPAFMMTYAGILFILSAFLVVYYQWKSNPDISLKVFWSIFGIYSIITGNFLADTLSFSRIFALGLAGGLLSMAINTMLFPKGPVTSIFAFVGALLAMFSCHIYNLGISILGAYVHTSRLQYLEFFTKFFESGGRPFRPFKEETKYIFLAEK